MSTAPRPRDDEISLYVYSDEDIEDILGDCYVDIHELVDEDDAAAVLNLVHDRLTDDFYAHRDE